MKKLLLFVLANALFLVFVNAQQIWISTTGAGIQPAEINLMEGSLQESAIEFRVEGFHQTTVQTPRGDAVVISTENSVQITEAGTPDLGKLFTSIIIPDMADMEITVTHSSFTDYPNFEVAPSKGHFTRDINPDDVPYTYGSAYKTDAFWPGVLAQLEDPFIFRDFRGQTVTVFPFQYNPITKILRVYTEIEVQIQPSGKPGVNVFTRTGMPTTFDPDFLQIYERTFLNKGNVVTSEYIIGDEGSLLIICHNPFMSAMQPFVDWKRTIGRKTELVSTNVTGTTATAIKNYVTNYYNTNPDFTHLLLIGDAPQIPTNSTSWGHSDNAYGFLVGNDQYNEIFVGRFSSENISHVQTQVQRMIEYERDMNQSDTWMRTGMGIARNEGTGAGHNGGENDYVHMDFIRDSLLNFTYDVVYRNYDGNVPGVPNTTAAIISQGVNDGVSIINFCNHGSTTGWSVANYSITHVNALTNVGKLPFIWSVACVNGNFVSNFCFAEAWLRATHNGEPTGAIGTMMSTINQAWQPPMTGQDEMVTILVEKRDHIKRTFGGLSINGSMKMISSHGNSGIQTHATWTLFGDPTLMVRTDVPEQINPAYNPVLLIGASSFTVTASNADGALTALSKVDNVTGEVTILGTAYFVAGTAIINLDEPVNEPGNLTLAITGFNKVTYINDAVQVIPPSGPYVVCIDHIVNDENGNDNGLADYGETVKLSVMAENVGTDQATGVIATLSTTNTFITITDNSYTFGNIPAGTTVTGYDAFEVFIHEDAPDGHLAIFEVLFSDGVSNNWTSMLTLPLHAPVIQLHSYTILDPMGNNNGKIDPGETVQLVIEIENTGSSDAFNIVGLLTCADPYITIIQNAQNYGNINADAVVGQTYTITAHITTPPGHPVTFDLDISGDLGLSASASFTEVVGQIPILIIDLDGNKNSAPKMMDAIANIDLTAEYATSFPPDLSLYSSIFLCVGVYPNNHVLTSAQGQILAAFLNNGGYLYMEGGDTWYYDPSTAVHNMFGINPIADGSGDLSTVAGINGTFTEDMSYSYNGDNSYIDRIQATGSAFLILQNTNPSYGTAVAYDQGSYKTIGASHEFGGLVDGTSTREELFLAYLEFLGFGPGALQASFFASITEICEGEVIEFYDMSTGNPNSWEWTFEGGMPENSSFQNPMVMYLSAGSYDVTLTVSDGVDSQTITFENFILVNVCTGINENNTSEIVIRPNPSNGLFTIELDQVRSDVFNIRVLNTLGNVVYASKEGNVRGNISRTIDLTGQMGGLYFVMIETNEETSVHRVIIK